MINIETIINKVQRDEFGRPSAILALYKQAGITAHDLVDQVRGILKTRKVGHAGALDTFATGVMIILVGKYTKFSDKLIDMDKSYRAKILFGVSTETQDPEGKISEISDGSSLTREQVEKAILKFKGKQNQVVSMYSSVKVNGKKLRVIMRDSRYQVQVNFKNSNKVATFVPKEGEKAPEFEVIIPSKKIEIYEIAVENFGEVSEADLGHFAARVKGQGKTLPKLFFADVYVACSKGTYIRQLAEDIGKELGLPAMLIQLERSSVGRIGLDKLVDITQLV